MAGEVKEKGKGIACGPVIPDISFIPALSQEELMIHNMQFSYQIDSNRRLSLENIPGVYDMSCMQLLALATNNTAGTSSAVGAGSFLNYGGGVPPYGNSWANSVTMESNPGTFLGVNAGSSVETPMRNPQYDVPTSQKFVYDLNLTPEEIMPTGPQPTEPEFTPISLDTPWKETRLPETVQVPATEKKKKRARNEKAAELKTPKQTPKRKKIRGKVVREGKKKSVLKSTVKKSPAAKSYVRPKRSSKRSIHFNGDFLDFEDYENSEDFEEQEDEDLLDTTTGMFGNIPKRRRQSWSSSTEQTLEKDPTGRNMEANDQTVSNRESLSMYRLHFPNIPRKRRTDGSLYNSARKRSRKITRTRKVRSLKKVSEEIKLEIVGYGTPHRPPPQLQAELSKILPNVPKNKRKNGDPIASKLNTRVLNLYCLRHFPRVTTPEERGDKYSVDLVHDLFKKLDITREGPFIPQNRGTALKLEQQYWEQLAGKMFKPDGTIIPYPTEKNHRTKVALDDETLRVWKLLMVNSNSEGIDGTDEANQKYWQEEREALHRYANSFITHMRLVQGDRRFSPWKGSVVDSVIGVFLTQNVTDHSSSSAFMDVAATFPILKSTEGSSELESSVTDETVLNSDLGIAVPSARLSNPTCIIEEIEDDDDDTDAGSSITSTNQGISTVSSTPTSRELNLNEVPIEVENDDAFRDDVSQVEPIYNNHQQVLQSTEDQEQNTKTEPVMKKPQRGRPKNPSNESFDWDSLRKKAEIGGKRERTERTMDTANWDAVRCSSVNEIAALIRQRGINNVLAQRIKAFLNRLVQDHGGIDLEWLRDVPPDQAKEYLLSVNGLGLKSVDCVRLLSLHQVAFPVDTNVGRIAVRLGWVPLQPLPDELQMHLLELYPVLATVQQYLWPRLCKLDQKTLYELHYHMITFGKVFCTKSKPNCKACPMKAECKHYASARRSEVLALPEPEEGTTAVTIHEMTRNKKPAVVNFRPSLLFTQDNEQEAQTPQNCKPPFVEVPASPEPPTLELEHDIEDCPWENNTEIPTIMLEKEAQASKELVVLSRQASSRPTRKLKNKERKRTEHIVYELPDNHPILERFERRDPADEFPYLLAIWTPGETATSSLPPTQECDFRERNALCQDKKCFPCNNIREEQAQIVRGTILIPCRTAMKGSFPLNGTYFQVNEVFADHGSSVHPIIVPRQLIWNLPRRIAYFGSSVTACFGGLPVEEIQYGFWRGYVCVRAFDRRTRRPTALMPRLHRLPSKANKAGN